MQTINLDQVQQLINIVNVLIITVVAFGTVGMGAAVLSLRTHKELLKMIYAGASPETQQLLRGFAVGVNDLADLAVEVTAPIGKAATAESLTPYVVTDSQPLRTEAIPVTEAAKSDG